MTRGATVTHICDPYLNVGSGDAPVEELRMHRDGHELATGAVGGRNDG